nr:hypothetical protein [Tanacetum cinerariifolium]
AAMTDVFARLRCEQRRQLPQRNLGRLGVVAVGYEPVAGVLEALLGYAHIDQGRNAGIEAHLDELEQLAGGSVVLLGGIDQGQGLLVGQPRFAGVYEREAQAAVGAVALVEERVADRVLGAVVVGAGVQAQGGVAVGLGQAGQQLVHAHLAVGGQQVGVARQGRFEVGPAQRA